LSCRHQVLALLHLDGDAQRLHNNERHVPDLNYLTLAFRKPYSEANRFVNLRERN
jgi:hypothetical protein